jgi:hypothetical protein
MIEQDELARAKARRREHHRARRESGIMAWLFVLGFLVMVGLGLLISAMNLLKKIGWI